MSAVSVIIPAYKAQDFIARAVKSVLAQTFQDFEIVIASDDGEDYLERLSAQGITDSRLRMISTGGIATGVSHARNTALAAASADIIATLDADDFFFPEKLEKMIPLARDYGFCTCGIRYVSYDHGIERELRHHNRFYAEGPVSAGTYPFVNYSTNAMMLFDRTRIRHGWEETLPVMEDLVFAMKAYNTIDTVYHIPEALHGYVKRIGSLCNAPDTAQQFIAAKQRILALLESDALGITDTAARETLRTFIITSLSAEEEFAALFAANPNAAFPEFLLDKMTRAGMLENIN